MSILVLLFDPDESMVSAFAKSLVRYGFAAFSSSTERAALRHLCESAPQVVVLEPVTLNSGASSCWRGRTTTCPRRSCCLAGMQMILAGQGQVTISRMA